MKLHTILKGSLYQRGEFHDKPTEQVVATLKENNIKTVVGLAGHKHEGLEQYGITYIFEKIPDGKRVNEQLVQEVLERAVRSQSENGGAILCHCHAGRNRSGLMSALLLLRLGYTPIQAIDIVRTGRPNALANPTFVEFLEGRKIS